MRIRSAVVSDLPAILDVANEVVAEDMWVTRGPGQEFEVKDFLDAMTHPDRAVFVAVRNEAIVGLLRLRPEADGHMHFGMMVRKAHRRQGAGKALLEAAIDWTVQRKVPELRLAVYAHNVAAIEMYRQTGFREVAYQPSYCKRRNGDVWDLIVMVRAFD
jgi:ribosomal protein S18 acetylase RimI-like enzyme